MGNALATSETACFKCRGSPARAPRSIQLPVLKMSAIWGFGQPSRKSVGVPQPLKKRTRTTKQRLGANLFAPRRANALRCKCHLKRVGMKC